MSNDIATAQEYSAQFRNVFDRSAIFTKDCSFLVFKVGNFLSVVKL